FPTRRSSDLPAGLTVRPGARGPRGRPPCNLAVHMQRTERHRTSLPLGLDEVLDARRRLEGVAIRTPLVTSRTLDERTLGRVFLKAENFQRGGAFKFRGAYNKISSLPPGTGVA